MADLPPRSNRILNDERIGGKQHTIVFNGLADQHAIEWVSMELGKFVQMKDGSLVQRESGDPMSLTFFRHKPIECAGEWQFTEGMLDRQFPNRHDTEEDFVGRIREDLARRWRQVFRARDDPQERAGIEKALHP